MQPLTPTCPSRNLGLGQHPLHGPISAGRGLTACAATTPRLLLPSCPRNISDATAPLCRPWPTAARPASAASPPALVCLPITLLRPYLHTPRTPALVSAPTPSFAGRGTAARAAATAEALAAPPHVRPSQESRAPAAHWLGLLRTRARACQMRTSAQTPRAAATCAARPDIVRLTTPMCFMRSDAAVRSQRKVPQTLLCRLCAAMLPELHAGAALLCSKWVHPARMANRSLGMFLTP